LIKTVVGLVEQNVRIHSVAGERDRFRVVDIEEAVEEDRRQRVAGSAYASEISSRRETASGISGS
jgi:hypothetical protein